MILGVGIDLVSVARIEELLSKFGTKFEERIFTNQEIQKAKAIKVLGDDNLARTLFYAKRFAAKEAFSKAIGFGIGKVISFQDIQINNDELGRPFIEIAGEKLNFLQDHFRASRIDINLSLSDEFLVEKKSLEIKSEAKSFKNYLAQAIVIISK
jgi:holo-[acyl-carrier protein] synthase